MLMMLASSGLTPSKGPTDAGDARLVGPPRTARTDADDARLVGSPRTARGQLMLMMLASSGLMPSKMMLALSAPSHSKGPTDADDARLVGPHA